MHRWETIKKKYNVAVLKDIIEQHAFCLVRFTLGNLDDKARVLQVSGDENEEAVKARSACMSAVYEYMNDDSNTEDEQPAKISRGQGIDVCSCFT
jgi:hypothetical protein